MWWYPGGAFWWTVRSNLLEAEDTASIVYPKAYLQASFETFLFMLGISWIFTCIGNYDVINSNRIHDVFGYNNVCVGFDTAPARYIAQPLMCLQAFYGMRYVTLDSLRSELEVAEGQPRSKSYWFTNVINNCYVITMLGWGMLLIVLPEGNSFAYHFYIYAVFVVVMYLTILANFFEEDWDRITWIGMVWTIVYAFHTFILLIVGTVGFNSYDYEKCPNDMVQTYKAQGNYTTLCLQDPGVPIGFMATLDYGWFLMLVLAPYCLPESRPIVYEKIHLVDNDDPLYRPAESVCFGCPNLCMPIGEEPACWTWFSNWACDLCTKCFALCGCKNYCKGEEKLDEQGAAEKGDNPVAEGEGDKTEVDLEASKREPDAESGDAAESGDVAEAGDSAVKGNVLPA